MNILFAANVMVACVLLVWPLWFSTRLLGLKWFNPLTITMLIGLPVELMKLFGGPIVLIETGLVDNGYQLALLMGNLLLTAQLAGLVFFFRIFTALRPDHGLPMRNFTLTRLDLRRGSRLFLLTFIIGLYLIATAEFGLINWLSNPREGYQLYRTGQGHWYALAVSSLGVSFLLSFLADQKPRSVLRTTAVYLSFGYLLGSKGILLSIFSSALIFLWFLRWPHLGRTLVILTPPLFFLLLFNLYLALADGFDLQAIAEYFDYYKNAADYYNGYLNKEIQLFHGEVAWSSYWAYVPRVLWPEKPVVYGVLIINEIFYPGQAELTNTPAFGGAVEQFSDFGVVGVLLFGFFSMQSISTALLSYLIYFRPGIRLDRITLVTVMLMIIQFAPAFGTYFPGALYLLPLAITMFLIRLMRLRKTRPAVASLHSTNHLQSKSISHAGHHRI